MINKILRLTRLTLVCFVLGIFSIISQAQDFSIGSTSINFIDSERNDRSIATTVYYPAAIAGAEVPIADGAFPLIAMAHGFLMGVGDYEHLVNTIVPMGYILCLPSTEGGFTPSHLDFGLDLAHIIAAMQEEGGNSASSFYNHIMTASAIMGHSMGGGASFLGVNSTITTLITFAPAETDPSAVANAENISIPSLIFAGNEDCVTPIADHQQPMYDALSSELKLLINIEDGTHCNFSSGSAICETGEILTNCTAILDADVQHQIVFRFLIPWLEVFLKGNCSQSEIIENEIAESVDVSIQLQGDFPASPPVPMITNQVGVLTTMSEAEMYNWYWNGNLIEGNSSSSLSIDNIGNYQLQVVDISGCTEWSEVIEIFELNLNDLPHALPQAFPNPNTGYFHLLDQERPFSIQIFDLNGKRLMALPTAAYTGLDLSDLGIGTYIVEFTQIDRIYYQKLIVIEK